MNWGTPKQTNEGAPNLLRLDPDVFVPVVADGIDRVVEGFERGVVVAGDFDSGTEVLGEVCAEEAAEAVHGDFFVADEDGVTAVDNFEGEGSAGGVCFAITVAFAGLLTGFGGGLTTYAIAFTTFFHAIVVTLTCARLFAIASASAGLVTIAHAGFLFAFAIASAGLFGASVAFGIGFAAFTLRRGGAGFAVVSADLSSAVISLVSWVGSQKEDQSTIWVGSRVWYFPDPIFQFR